MLDLKALPMLRKNLDAFIRADPLMISLARSVKIQTDAGGWVKGPPVILAPQQFRIGWFTRRLSKSVNNTAEGYISVQSYIIIGRWDVDLLRDDEFDYQGNHYIVDEVEPKTDDRTHTDRVVGILRSEVGDKAPPVPV
jgi:hypothetical protein